MVFQQPSTMHFPMSICITIVEKTTLGWMGLYKQTHVIDIALIFFNPQEADNHLHKTPMCTDL